MTDTPCGCTKTKACAFHSARVDLGLPASASPSNSTPEEAKNSTPEEECRCDDETNYMCDFHATGLLKLKTAEDAAIEWLKQQGRVTGEPDDLCRSIASEMTAYTASLRTQLEQAQQELRYKKLGLKAMAELNNAGSALIRDLRKELEQAQEENEELERQVELEIHDRDASITRAQTLEVELKQMAEALEDVLAVESCNLSDEGEDRLKAALKLTEARRKG